MKAFTACATGQILFYIKLPGVGTGIAAYNNRLWKNAIYTTKRMRPYRRRSTVRNAGLRWNIPSSGGGGQRRLRFHQAQMKEIGRNSKRQEAIVFAWTISCDARIPVAGKRSRSQLCRRWFLTSPPFSQVFYYSNGSGHVRCVARRRATEPCEKGGLAPSGNRASALCRILVNKIRQGFYRILGC